MRAPELPDLSSAERGLVAATWAFRASAERSAELRFQRLHERLVADEIPMAIVALAERAVSDEARHIGLCDSLARKYGWTAETPPPTPYHPIGPSALDASDRFLYEMVAFCCVTESVNAAMLLAVRERVTAPDVRETVVAILRDEVQHSKLGWAYLAHTAAATDVAWLGEWIPRMLHGAGVEEVFVADDGRRDGARLAAYGELSLSDRIAIFRGVMRDVVLPGLERAGVPCTEARAWLGRLDPDAPQSWISQERIPNK